MHIDVPKTCDPDDRLHRSLVISGHDPVSCTNAKIEIETIITRALSGESVNGGGPKILPAGHIEQIVLVPDDRIGALIGRGGSNVKGIQMRTGTRIQIPKTVESGTSHRKVVVTGPGQGVVTAAEQVQNIAAGGYATDNFSSRA